MLDEMIGLDDKEWPMLLGASRSLAPGDCGSPRASAGDDRRSSGAAVSGAYAETPAFMGKRHSG
jgi:hypothetical protein